MAEQATDTKPASESKAVAESKNVAALGELVNAATALQAIQAQAAIEAMRLPEKRLDDASEDGGAAPYTLRDDGDGKFTKVDAFGNEYKGRD